MKKHIKTMILIMAFALAAGLCACSERADYSGKTVVGQVTAIDGDQITLQLGELKEIDLDDMDFGGGMQMPGGFGQSDQFDTFDELEGSSESPTGFPNGMMPNGGGTPPEMPNGGQQGDFDVMPGQTDGEMPNGGGTPPEMPSGGQQGGFRPMPGGMDFMNNGFVAGEETLTLNIDGSEIKIEFGGETAEGSIESIRIGSVLEVELGNDGNAQTVTVKFTGSRGMRGDRPNDFGAASQQPNGDFMGDTQTPPETPDGENDFNNMEAAPQA